MTAQELALLRKQPDAPRLPEPRGPLTEALFARRVRPVHALSAARLRLFVADRSLRRSRAAQAAIEDLVDWLYPRPCEVEVVDVLDDPQMASFHRVVVTPAVWSSTGSTGSPTVPAAT